MDFLAAEGVVNKGTAFEAMLLGFKREKLGLVQGIWARARIATVLLAAGSVLTAQHALAEGAFGTSVNSGAFGLSSAYTLKLSETWNARFGMENFKHPWGLRGDDLGYTLAPTGGLGSAMLDWRPTGGIFRVSGGLMGGIKGEHASQGDYSFLAPRDPFEEAVEYQSTRLPIPYLGVGVDIGDVRAAGWNFNLDLGFLLVDESRLGSSSVGNGGLPSYLTPALRSNVEDSGGWRYDVGDLQEYPVLSIGARYRW
jgi:hypothetical protein